MQDWSDISLPGTIRRVFKLDSEVLPSPDPLSITLPTFDVDLVIATQCPVESQSLGPVHKVGKAVDLIVIATAWKGLQFAFERRQPGRVCRQVHLALFDRTARGLEPGFLVLVRSNAVIAPAVITKQFVQKRFARSGILDQNSIRIPIADKLQCLGFQVWVVHLPAPDVEKVLSDEFEPVSVCHGNREPIRNKVDATR
ncbi:hypothetical protein RUA4292_02933 [Ruegeria atlantica]|uniref:Uncharacterized protein n=1 Tax=Ruegeria atlantica TaxID=81569 RepID=A0A0P1EF98_9RHOB|nr:hypothetical protein RUA4292_02933 [Ruegeria atlantica]